jgi:hypothetical protein
MQEKTQGLTFYSSQHPDELRPLVHTIWEFLLPTLSTTFSDARSDQQLWHDCLQGIVEAACLTSSLNLAFNTSAFVRTLANFTSLHEPHKMRMPNVHALRKLLLIPDRVGQRPNMLLCCDCVSVMSCIAMCSLEKFKPDAIFLEIRDHKKVQLCRLWIRNITAFQAGLLSEALAAGFVKSWSCCTSTHACYHEL